MSATTPEQLRDFWLSREGSQRGQYRLGYHDAGILFQRIGDLETELTRLHMQAPQARPTCDAERYSVTDREMRHCHLEPGHPGDHEDAKGKRWLPL